MPRSYYFVESLLSLAMVGVLGPCISGCASVVPPFDLPVDDRGAPTLQSISDRITCELASMVAPSSDYGYKTSLLLGDVDVGVLLSLTVNDAGGLAPSLTYMDAPFSFGTNALYSRSREQNYVSKLYFSLRQLREEVASNPDELKCPEVDTNLAGDLGLRNAVDLAMTTSHLNMNAKLKDSDGAFGGYVTFLVTKNLNGVGPTWALKHFKGPGGLASLSEVNTDKITFAFARGKNVGKALNVFTGGRTERIDNLLDQLNVNQLTVQFGSISRALQQ